MRVSNNNQTTFGMNKLILDQATPELVSRVNRVRARILKIGNPQTVCEIGSTPSGKVCVEVYLQNAAGRGFGGGLQDCPPSDSLTKLVRRANAIMTQHLTDEFSAGGIR
jgi:hypothetical protein